jgi:hypothetical protein
MNNSMVDFSRISSMYGALGTKSMEDILEGLRDKEDRKLSLNPTPQQPSAHPHKHPHRAT